MRRVFTIIFLLVLCICATAQQVGAVQPSTASAQARARYLQRTQTIVRDMRYALGQFFLAWEEMEALSARPRRQQTEAELQEKSKRQNALRTDLLKSLTAIRVNARRLRSVSPVPRAFIKADDRFISSSYALSAAMNDLESWLVQPTNEWKAQTEKHLRQGMNQLVAAEQLLMQRTEAGVINKSYVD